jgi:GntR family transcriptional regulator
MRVECSDWWDRRVGGVTASSLAVYRQIIQDIEAQIDSGVLCPGDRLPSLSQLAPLYGCSAQPVRLALRLLQHSGVLEGHQGRGVYVTTCARRSEGGD